MHQKSLFSGVIALVAVTAVAGCGRVVLDGKEGNGQDGVHGIDDGDDGDIKGDPGGDPSTSGITDDCDVASGYEINGFDKDPGADGVPLRLVGVYETNGDHSFNNHPQGTFDLTVNSAGPQYIAVSAYEPTEWTIHAGPDAQILGVYAIGYYEQVIKDASGAPIVSDSYDTGGDSACGYSWPPNNEGCDTKEMVQKIEGMAGRSVSMFRGCYHMTELTFLP